MSFGRLERSKGSEPMSEINVTPMVDVMLVLLVIFILTAPLMASSIKLDLPKTDAAKASEAPKFVTLVVDKTGQIFLNDKPIVLDELRISHKPNAVQTRFLRCAHHLNNFAVGHDFVSSQLHFGVGVLNGSLRQAGF